MGRARLFRTSLFAYHISVRSNNKDWFYLPQTEVWKIYEDIWLKTQDHFIFYVHAFVLMSNHLHFIITTPNEDLDLVMRYFLTESARSIQRLSKRINHIYGGRYKWSVLGSRSALAYGFKYVQRNPVVAGLSRAVEEYPFNAHFRANFTFPITQGFDNYWSLIPKDRNQFLAWLNKPAPKEAEALIGRALRRYEFKLSTDNAVQKNLRILRAEYGVD